MSGATNLTTVESTAHEQELLAALEREIYTCKRQALLKAIWHLRNDHPSKHLQSDAVLNLERAGHTTHDRNSTRHRSPQATLVD